MWNFSRNISRNAGESLTAQLQNIVRSEIAQGVLHPGTPMPSTRRLAADLSVSRSVVVEAYGQLVAEGYLEAVRGSGTRVARHLAPPGATPPDPRPEPALPAFPPAPWIDLRTGGADSTPHFPHREWLASYQRALYAVRPGQLDYPPLPGMAPLREELARYMGRVRGVCTAPEQVMVVSGFAQGLGLLCSVLPHRGAPEMAVEDPCHQRLRGFVQDAGMRPLPIPVDREGIDVEALARSGARAVLVTPTHQFPTGAVLSAQRRDALLRWAHDVDGWIVEDDYDGDLWFDRAPRPLALQRRAPDRVVHAGTVSKALVPGLRLGWLVAPPSLFADLERVRARRDLGHDVLTQLAFADLMASGAFDRHLRSIRARYRGRREAFTDALQRHLPEASLPGAAAGLHVYVGLPRAADEVALVAAALRRGVRLRGGREFHAAPHRARPALVVGYAAHSRTELRRAAAELAAGYAQTALPGSASTAARKFSKAEGPRGLLMLSG